MLIKCFIYFLKYCVTIFVQVFCTDPCGLIDKPVSDRSLSPATTDVHIGIDGGQGWLKLGLILTDRNKVVQSGRAKYSEVRCSIYINLYMNRFIQGVASKDAKDSSVKKLLLLAVLPECSETYESVQFLLRKLCLEDVPCVFSADLKMCKFISFL